MSIGDRKIVMCCCGDKFTIFLDADGKLTSIGFLRPFREKTESEISMIVPKELRAIIKDDVSNNTTFVKICSGLNHCLATDETGRLYSWGESDFGALGGKLTSIKEPT